MSWKCLLYGGCEYEVYKEDPYRCKRKYYRNSICS